MIQRNIQRHLQVPTKVGWNIDIPSEVISSSPPKSPFQVS